MAQTVRNASDAADKAIAIIGLGAKLPGALDTDAFWQNIIGEVSSIGEVPADRWDAELYFDPDPNAPEKTYSKIGGWITGFDFDRKKYRLPPTVVDKMDPTQLLCLEAVHEAMEDAGYLDADFDREGCAVILGNAMGGDLRDRTNLRVFYAEVDQVLRQTLAERFSGRLSGADIDELADMVETRFKRDLADINEDSMPGELANVVAGRVAALFNLRGPNFVTDAACASSLAAVEQAVRGLQLGQFDMAVTGGVDRCMGAPTFVKFAKIGALSPDGSRPFDAAANGFVMGEGGGVLILKRLADALRDGDKVYATIRGIGGSSDGKGKGITAPNPVGQELAVRRAYQDAGFGPRSVSLIEAHGTATPVGDPVEAASLKRVILEDDGPRGAERIALGSVKSMIGHLKAGAGAASLVKVALAMHHRTLPPTLNVTEPNPRLEIAQSPFRIQHHAQPWETADGVPRRAGVSAFGFGGTNFHVALEEFQPQGGSGGAGIDGSKKVFAMSSSTTDDTAQAHAPAEAEPAVHDDGILAFVGASLEAVQAQFEAFADDFAERGLAATADHRLATESADLALPDGPVRLAITYTSADELDKKVGRTRKAFAKGRGWRILSNQGIFLAEADAPGKLAMLFPGQGTQYIGMLAGLRDRFAVVDETFAEADRIMQPLLGRTLSSIIFPEPGDLSTDEAEELLRQTEVTQPAVLTVNVALMRLFEQFGIRPEIVAGHSLGEYGACLAAGVMSFEDALRTVAARGTQMAKATPMNGDKGLMASIPASVDEVEAVLAEVDGYVVCANKNCPKQTIIAGLTEPVRQAVAKFEAMGHTVHMLNVSHAFHTKVVASASEPLRGHLDSVAIQTPQIPILTNVTGRHYPTDPDAIRDLLAVQLASPVEYITLLETMYDEGARIFMECGPKRAQTTFVDATLGGHDDVVSLFTNHPKYGDVGSLFDALGRLWADGVWKAASVATVDAPADQAAAQTRGTSPVSRDEILSTTLDVLCDKTGYDRDEIETDFELEADLGIDTVKQAEIMATVREQFALPKDEDFRLADYPTLDALADYTVERLASVGSSTSTATETSTSTATATSAEPAAPAAKAPAVPSTEHQRPSERSAPTASREDILSTTLDVLCDKTGYDRDEIETDFELEADLGIDTVKQAEIMATVREQFALPKDEDFRLADYPTLDALADYTVERLASVGSSTRTSTSTATETSTATATSAEPAQPAPSAQRPTPNAGDARSDVTHHARPARIEITGTALGLPGHADLFDPEAIDRLLDGENFIGDIPMALRQEMVDKHITRLQKHKNGGGELVPVEDVAEVIKLAGRGAADFDLERDWGLPKRFVEQLDRTSQMAIAAGLTAIKDAGLPLIPRYRETRSGKKITIGWTLPADIGAETGVIFASAFAGEDALIEEVRARYSDPERYEFNHRFLVRVLGMANARFAEMIGARGPNTRINNACASTTTAIAMAEDWVRCGRCKRVIIISADDASGDTLMDWVGSGFLATGAATTKADVAEAALPFDKRRHGMIIGMGAVGLVVEEGGLCEARGIEPVADVLATHFVNSALHPTRLDVDHIAGEVGKLLGRAEADFGIERTEIADKTVFVSHETYTPARGGSADAEIQALRQNFGDAANQIIVANTKGFTGHAMGAGIEDVLASRALQKQRLPHIANFEQPDPNLGDLRLSQGGDYPVDYALRLAAGFGSQLALALMRYRARQDARIFDAPRYQQWLAEVSGFDHAQAVIEDRTFRLREGDADQAELPAEIAGGVRELPSGPAVTAAPAEPAEPATEAPTVTSDQQPATRGRVATSDRVAASGASRDEILSATLAVLCDKTGYDPDEIELDFELEADLGIDTVKQAEIMATVREQFALPKDDDFRLADYPTLNALADYTVERLARVGSSTSTATETSTSTATATTAEPAARAEEKAGGERPAASAADAAKFQPRPILVEAHTATAYDVLELKERLTGKRVVILGGPMLVRNTMLRAAERCGAEVHIIEDSANRSPLDGDDSVANLLDETAIERAFAEVGNVDGIINLLGYGQDNQTTDDVYRAARQTYHVARAWQRHLGRDPAGEFFVSVTGMGGRLGFDQATRPLPVCGSVCGLTKALGREWPEAAVRVVDVAREGFYPELGLQVLGECFAEVPSLEVGIIGGVRYVPVIVDAEDIVGHGAGTSYAPDADSVVVVVGGAKGITAEVCVDLAQRFGCKLALVGRSTLDHADPLSVDMDQAKKEAKERIAARGERVTPVAVRNELYPLESARTIAANMQRMRQAGAEAEYFSCDVADADSVRGLIADVEARFGRVDGVIHAAGVEESKLLADKDLASFDRVFRGKALGGLNLWQAVREHEPTFFVAFSSVAGRFGNAGQVDYSAANEVLSKLVAQINATTDTRALSIDWTAWDEVGMATEGSMKTILEHRGVEFLPPHIGAPIVGDSLERGLTGECLVAGELGEMAGEAALEVGATGLDESSVADNDLVFVDRITAKTDRRVVVERVFDPERDYFLADHVYQGVPVMPGVMGYEFMVEAASQLAGGQVLDVSEVAFERAIKFHHDEPLRLIASAEVVEECGTGTTLRTSLESERQSATGRTLRHTHFTATVQLGHGELDDLLTLELDAAQPFEAGPTKLDIYKRFFHTGRFQVLESVPHVGPDAVIGYGRKPAVKLTARQNGHVFVTDPMVREMALQTIGLWGMKHHGRSYLPLGIGRSVQYASARPGEGVCVRAVRRDDPSEHAIAFDVEVLGDDGRLLQRMAKVELIGHRQLADDEQFGAFEPRTMTTRRLSGPEADLVLSDLGLTVDELLEQTERQALERLISDKRRAEWLAARVAAKQLVADYLRDFYGVRPALGDVVIAKDDHGAPHVELRGQAAGALAGVALPCLSLTHSSGVAIAALAQPATGDRLGVDLERVETRDQSFADNYFTAAERQLAVPGDQGGDAALLTLLWSVKESVSKALGLGLHLKLGEILVEALEATPQGIRARVALRDRAAEAFETLGATAVEVTARVDGSFVLSVAHLSVDAALAGESAKAASEPAGADAAPAKAVVAADQGWVDMAAVAALLKHKGLLNERQIGKSKVKGEDLSPWKM